MTTQQENYEELQKKLDALRDDFSELAKTIKDISSAYVAEGQQSFKQAASGAQSQVKDSINKVQSEVEANPFSGMAVSFGVGLLIGKLLSR